MASYTITITSTNPEYQGDTIILADGDDLRVTMPPPPDPEAISHYEALIEARAEVQRLTGRCHEAENALANLRMDYDELAGRHMRGERP